MSSNSNQTTETSYSRSSLKSPITNVSSPYFLHSSDHPGVLLVSNMLTCDNYPTWKISMKMALNAKNKLGLIDGSMAKSAETFSRFERLGTMQRYGVVMDAQWN
ncbi:hypothetical protein Dsin_030707 [Dipteronia sinensis]|uniref:Retrotransposon Copia-like N-terminal domain-containing protein n=1 Tax=Dipteronia sinensis TaxID=43782 RepID=A0AAE0DRB9_9ROSI|nr:hypothetical protein Dsin_030707 [Dipteronia sinensis]